MPERGADLLNKEYCMEPAGAHPARIKQSTVNINSFFIFVPLCNAHLLAGDYQLLRMGA